MGHRRVRNVVFGFKLWWDTRGCGLWFLALSCDGTPEGADCDFELLAVMGHRKMMIVIARFFNIDTFYLPVMISSTWGGDWVTTSLPMVHFGLPFLHIHIFFIWCILDYLFYTSTYSSYGRKFFNKFMHKIRTFS